MNAMLIDDGYDAKDVAETIAKSVDVVFCHVVSTTAEVAPLNERGKRVLMDIKYMRLMMAQARGRNAKLVAP